jgi:hypothetical protein
MTFVLLCYKRGQSYRRLSSVKSQTPEFQRAHTTQLPTLHGVYNRIRPHTTHKMYVSHSISATNHYTTNTLATRQVILDMICQWRSTIMTQYFENSRPDLDFLWPYYVSRLLLDTAGVYYLRFEVLTVVTCYPRCVIYAYYRVGSDAVWSGRSLSTFRTSVLPPSTRCLLVCYSA